MRSKGLAIALLAVCLFGQTAQAANFYQGVATNNLPWPGGIIPYVFTTNVTATEQAVYLQGMKEWALGANVQFIPRTTQSQYVILDLDYLQGTNTYVATVPPVMTIDNLSRAQICHETGHLLGFQHEHVRVDRNDYIIVNFENIAGNSDGTTNGSGEGSGDPASLYLIDSNSTPNGPYDFQSVMSYSRTLFSIDPATLDVIDPLPPYVYEYYNRIGNVALSVGDLAGAAFLYGPAAAPLTNVVTTTADFGPGSLRAAIYYANEHPGTTVRFNIPTNDPGFSNGVYTIYVSGQLPPLVANGTVIDATTQPGYPGIPFVALSGSHVLPETEFEITGLYFYAGNSTVRGLAFNNFSMQGIGLLYNYAASNHVEGCYVGVAPDGVTPASNNYEGIVIAAGAHDNIIGGTNASQRNVISDNAGYGITITDTNSDGNVVEGDYIGLTADGSAAASNTLSGIGIWGGSCSNIIGAPAAGNVLSGNGQYGVFIGDTNTVGTVLQGNFVGTGQSGRQAVANGYGGIGVFGGANNVTIGGAGAGAGNLLSGNGNAGLWLDGPGVNNNVAQGNWIGVDATGTAALPNGFVGIYILDGAVGNLIGGAAAGAANVISGNVSEGIFISDPGTTNNLVQGNFIGTGAGGANPVGNGYTGVGIWSGASFNWIGGTNAAQRNILSGNDGNGVSLGGAGTVNNQILGNYIGLEADGATVLGNQGIGVYIEVGPQFTSVGGVEPGAANVISANGSDGIQLWGAGTCSNFVEGNLVGTDKTGTLARGNLGSALSLIAGPTFNTVGGTVPAARNILSASAGDGVYGYQATNNLIEGNYIGTDVTGVKALSNAGEGMIFFDGSPGNQIISNVIAASGEDGIFLGDPGTSANLIQGNKIGLGADGATPLGNALQGILIDNGAFGNVIGLTLSGNGTGNLIAGNTNQGVIIYDTNSTGNTIRGNAIFNNGGIAIELVGGDQNSYGVTANHPGGAVPGPNDLQNYPLLASASVDGKSTVVAGTLNSGSNQSFLIDLYRNASADPSGYGPGQIFAGTILLQTASTGNGSFSLPLPGAFAGQYFSATATDLATGDTSEFSADLLATNNPAGRTGGFSGPYVLNAAGFSFDVVLATNQNYTIQSTTNLAQPLDWENITNFFATTSPMRIMDTNTPSKERFYRVVTP
jgi:titin